MSSHPNFKKKIIIATKNRLDYEHFNSFFSGKQYDYFDVIIHYGDIFHTTADCIATAGNSYGMMDGGLDSQINSYARNIQNAVQSHIDLKWFGEIPVGVCFILYIGCNNHKHLAYVPTMKVPQDVSGSINAYLSLRGLLTQISLHNMRSVALPLFCNGSGMMSAAEVCHQYHIALSTWETYVPDWRDIWKKHRMLIHQSD